MGLNNHIESAVRPVLKNTILSVFIKEQLKMVKETIFFLNAPLMRVRILLTEISHYFI